MSAPKINWHKLASDMELITETKHGRSERSGTKVAMEAIVKVLDDQFIIDTVDYQISNQAGSELARSVLMLLRPKIAMQRCWQIFESTNNEQTASFALFLLRDICDESIFGKVSQLINNENALFRLHAIHIIDELCITQEVIEIDDAMKFIEMGLEDDDETVQQQTKQLSESIKHQQHFLNNGSIQ